MKNNKKQIVRWILLILSCFMMIGVYIRYNIPNYSHQVFGVTYMTMNNPFYEVIDNQLEKVIEANGDQLIILDPSLDIDKQIEQIRSFIRQKVSGFLSIRLIHRLLYLYCVKLKRLEYRYLFWIRKLTSQVLWIARLYRITTMPGYSVHWI